MKHALFSGLITDVVLWFVPVVAVFVYLITRMRRKTKTTEAAALPFDPQPSKTELFLTQHSSLYRNLSPANRAYVLHQVPFAGSGLLHLWTFFVFLSCGLLPQFVNVYRDTQPLPVRVWYSYLTFASPSSEMIGILSIIFALMTAAIALGEITLVRAPAAFFRTRPIARSVLFWTRVGGLLATLLLAFFLAAALSFLLLLAVYGPVWRHLLDTAPMATLLHTTPASPTSTDILNSLRSGAGHALWAAQTSLPRLILSLATTMTLVFSTIAVLITLPARPVAFKAILSFVSGYALIGMYMIYPMLGDRLVSTRVGRILFLYPHPGPPPPYIWALAPIALSAMLLALAKRNWSRLEP
jgi:hypothetical protein